MTRRLAVLVIFSLVFISGSRCALRISYDVKSAVNEAAFYRARYLEKCGAARLPDVPCDAWVVAQRKLDAAALEAREAQKVGGSQHLQATALRRNLEAVRKEFSKWAISEQ